MNIITFTKHKLPLRYSFLIPNQASMETHDFSFTYSTLALTELPMCLQDAVRRAEEESCRAYAPYSGFQVGAAVLLSDGTLVGGNNQENAAYPSGLCAERVALFHANATYPDKEPIAIAIVARRDGLVVPHPVPPCGSCRQVLLESEKRYGHPIQVLLYDGRDVTLLSCVHDLLPLSFSDTML